MKKHTLNDISIIIVTFKGDELTKNCLDSLRKTCGTAPQIIVVDNSPSESTRLIVEAHSNSLYVPSHGNPGFAGGNNRALRHCTGDYILLLNNDTIVRSRDSIELLIKFLDDNPKSAVAQGSGRLSRAGNTLAGCGSFLTPTGFMWSPGFNQKECPEFDKTHPCFVVSGFFMLFRRDILPQVGNFLFRTHFWCYYEETDFCHRVWLSGNEVWYVKTPPIDHLCGATANLFSRADIMTRYLKNLLFSLTVNLSFWQRMRIMPLCKALLIGHSFFHLLKGNVGVFKSDWRALLKTRYEKSRIKAAKRQVKRIRTVSDRVLFRTIFRMPSMRDFIRHICANA